MLVIQMLLSYWNCTALHKQYWREYHGKNVAEQIAFLVHLTANKTLWIQISI
jgi:hypothetical protein